MRFSVDPADTRRFFQDKREKRVKKLEERLARAQSDAAAVVKMIIGDYHPEKIWQWGSLVRTGDFSEISDIDIALEGDMPPKDFFELLDKADAMTPFKVDIVRMETIEPVYARSIRKNGRCVYQRKTP